MLSAVRESSVYPSISIRDLPPQVLEDVFSFLSPREVVSRAALTCREWRAVARPPLSNRLLPGLRRCTDATQICDLLQREAGRDAANLTHLDLRDKGLGDAGVEQVCAWLTQHAPGLFFLDLSGNALTSAGAAALTFPASLRVLNLADNALGAAPQGIGDAAASMRLALPAQVSAVNVSCNANLTLAYLDAQDWPTELKLLAAACCDVQGNAVPANLERLEHLDLSFNAGFAANSFPPVRHLDVRGTRSWKNLVSTLHREHPTPDLERLLTVPLMDSESRSLASWQAGASLATGVFVCGSLAAAAQAPAWAVVVAGLCALPAGLQIHVHTQDFHVSTYARTGKRAGDPWYVHDAKPMQARSLPRGAATLQCLVNGVIAGLSTGCAVGVVFGGQAFLDFAAEGGMALGSQASAALGGGFWGATVNVLLAVAGFGAGVSAYWLAYAKGPDLSMRLSQRAAQHAARKTYEIAEKLEAYRGFDLPRSWLPPRYSPLADMV